MACLEHVCFKCGSSDFGNFHRLICPKCGSDEIVTHWDEQFDEHYTSEDRRAKYENEDEE